MIWRLRMCRDETEGVEGLCLAQKGVCAAEAEAKTPQELSISSDPTITRATFSRVPESEAAAATHYEEEDGEEDAQRHSV